VSDEGIAGLRAAIDDVSGLLRSLDDGEWAAAGWTAKDGC
jgi:hypothetical protein